MRVARDDDAARRDGPPAGTPRHDASLVERVTRSMRAAEFDHLSIGSGTVAWAPDGHTIAFVAKEGPRDQILLWSLYDKELGQTLAMPDLD